MVLSRSIPKLLPQTRLDASGKGSFATASPVNQSQVQISRMSGQILGHLQFSIWRFTNLLSYFHVLLSDAVAPVSDFGLGQLKTSKSSHSSFPSVVLSLHHRYMGRDRHWCFRNRCCHIGKLVAHWALKSGPPLWQKTQEQIKLISDSVESSDDLQATRLLIMLCVNGRVRLIPLSGGHQLCLTKTEGFVGRKRNHWNPPMIVFLLWGITSHWATHDPHLGEHWPPFKRALRGVVAPFVPS